MLPGCQASQSISCGLLMLGVIQASVKTVSVDKEQKEVIKYSFKHFNKKIKKIRTILCYNLTHFGNN